jgi:hypothetical protein
MMFNEKSGTVARERTNGHLELADGFGGPRARDDGFAAINDLVELEQRYGSVYASQANCVDLATSSTQRQQICVPAMACNCVYQFNGERAES